MISRKESVNGIIITSFVLVCGIILYDSYQKQEISPPPPVVYVKPEQRRVYTPSECVVEVFNQVGEDRHYGKGIIIESHGETIVLTSSMIFGVDGQAKIRRGPDCYDADILHRNDVWGLVALECYLPGPTTTLNDDLNIPPLVPVDINGWSASTLEYINDDWVLLGDLPEGDYTGNPVIQNGYVVGIVVGMNQINPDQAIMVGNRALKEFCDQATHLDTLPVWEVPQ